MNKRKRKKLLRIALAKEKLAPAVLVEEKKELQLGLKELKEPKVLDKVEVVEEVASEVTEAVETEVVTEVKPTRKKKS